MLAADPSNSFLRYGLAMDLLSSGDAQAAAAEFETLIASDPTYLAAYFHGGRALEQLGRTEAAREIYTRGIAAAQAKGDTHTLAELEGALALLG
jgi:Tfp pilus assembly protein PilF